MDIRRLKPPLGLSLIALFVVLVISLHLMSSATQDSSALGGMYSKLLLINSLGSFLLLLLVGANIYWLLRQLKKRVAGSRLTARMAFLFILLALAPSSIVFYYSMQFLQQSIDSWFDVRIDHAMEDALELGQAALDERMRTVLKQTGQIAAALQNIPESMLAITLDGLRGRLDDKSELTLFSREGRVLLSLGYDPENIILDLPGDSVLFQVSPGKPYVGLEPSSGGRLKIRAVVYVRGDGEEYFLQALHPISAHLSELAQTVEEAFIHYRELTYLRSSLKTSFALTLSLVLLLSLLAAIWSAFLSIRSIVMPLRRLAEGTQAVAAGHYEQRLPVNTRDELGFLVESFNVMTARIARARDEAHSSQLEVERHRAYLQTVLGNLSTGIMSFDSQMRLQTSNQAADTILHADLASLHNQFLAVVAERYPHLTELVESIGEQSPKEKPWQDDVQFHGAGGRQQLLCRGTPLFDPENVWQGAVVVFDDVTALMQAQRRAAWGEVAQRLAHEIKNPLTPIQLSAERLQHKLSRVLTSETDAAMLERSTRTIVQQVEAMKSMVNAFAEYAKPSAVNLQRMDIAQLVTEVIALYPPRSGVDFDLQLDSGLFFIYADPVRMRQILHNIFKNALEACGTDRRCKLQIRLRHAADDDMVELLVRDNGPGIPQEQAERLFEPYVTTKSKGTGLGLAIVKKIIEEHGGTIWLDTAYHDGAGFVIRLPAA
jgi:nitrogen fixation/metabolism regulation signal transduction histidine kinase